MILSVVALFVIGNYSIGFTYPQINDVAYLNIFTCLRLLANNNSSARSVSDDHYVPEIEVGTKDDNFGIL